MGEDRLSPELALEERALAVVARYGVGPSANILSARELGISVSEFHRLYKKAISNRDLNPTNKSSAIRGCDPNVLETVSGNVMSLILEGHHTRTFWAKEMLQELSASKISTYSACCSSTVNVDLVPNDMGTVAKVPVCNSCGKPCEIVKLSPKDRYSLIFEGLQHLAKMDKDVADMAAALKYINPDAADDNLDGVNPNNYQPNNVKKKVKGVDVSNAIDAEVSKSFQDLSSYKPHEVDMMLRSLEKEIDAYRDGAALRLDQSEVIPVQDSGTTVEESIPIAVELVQDKEDSLNMVSKLRNKISKLK